MLRQTLFQPINQEKMFVVSESKQETTALAPTFNVKINHPTMITSLETYENEFKNCPVSGVLFKIEDSYTLNISISPTEPFEKSDSKFREAVGKLSPYRLTIRDHESILQHYKQYVDKYKLDPRVKPKSQHANHSIRPGGSHAF